jgi:hypothetical protein
MRAVRSRATLAFAPPVPHRASRFRGRSDGDVSACCTGSLEIAADLCATKVLIVRT